MYPMMPHISCPLTRELKSLRVRLASRFRPSLFVDLFAAGNRQRVRLLIVCIRRPRPDIRAATDADGCNQLTVAADEGAVLDHRRVLLLAVVVARDRAGADVYVLANR